MEWLLIYLCLVVRAVSAGPLVSWVPNEVEFPRSSDPPPDMYISLAINGGGCAVRCFSVDRGAEFYDIQPLNFEGSWHRNQSITVTKMCLIDPSQASPGVFVKFKARPWPSLVPGTIVMTNVEVECTDPVVVVKLQAILLIVRYRLPKIELSSWLEAVLVTLGVVFVAIVSVICCNDRC